MAAEAKRAAIKAAYLKAKGLDEAATKLANKAGKLGERQARHIDCATKTSEWIHHV
jgi:hypothetical protein